MEEIKIKLAYLNGNIDKIYSQEVTKLIRKKYSASDELTILRKKLANTDISNEFAMYNAYVETCDLQVKAEIQKVLNK